MERTVQYLSKIPIKFGYVHYTIIPRIITRWCQKGRFECRKVGKKYYIEEQTFIDFARFNYFPRSRKPE